MDMKDNPVAVSYGAGVDSTAVIVEMVRRGERIDAILFSDTGGEKDETVAYIDVMNEFLAASGYPVVTTVKYQPKKFKHAPYRTLHGNCIANRTLPSLAFGYKSCSLKWKGQALDKYASLLFGDAEAIRIIGYDCSAKDTRRFYHAQNKAPSGARPQDTFRYPLQEWGWDRERCKSEIAAAGLPVPPKSSCTFCPAMKACEVAVLPKERQYEIVVMEANARPNLTKINGLWRKKRMTDFLVDEGHVSASAARMIERHWGGEAHASAPNQSEKALSSYIKGNLL